MNDTTDNQCKKKFNEKWAETVHAILSSDSDKQAHKLIKKAILKGYPVATEEDPFGATLLHWAASANRLRCCRALLEAGCNVNKKQDVGKTPFYNACHYGNINCAKVLLDYGADPNIPNDDGVLPLEALEDIAGTEARKKLEKYIKTHYRNKESLIQDTPEL